jgi:hypothetical protein
VTAPDLSGALEGLKLLESSDLHRYKLAVEKGEQKGWGYYFPYLLTRNKADSAVLVSEDDGSLCVFLWRLRESVPRLNLAVAPMPMNPSVVERCLERANDFNGDRSARILRVDEKDVDAVSSLRRVRVRPRRSQYIYEPRRYEDLGGGRFKTLRRNTALVESLPDVEVMPYSPAHAEDCRALLRRWQKKQSESHGTLGGLGISRGAIELAGTLPERDLRGEVVFVDGRLCAYAFGGQIRPGLGCFLERRCDHRVRGLSYFHLRSFLLELRDCEFVNDGSDAGRAGLRQVKDSFRPVAMHTEYRASQKRA